MSLGSLLPAFGATIRCPCCDRSIPALVLTHAYLCPRHGLFEVSAAGNGIIHYSCLPISFIVYDFLIGGQHHDSVAHSGSC